MYSLPELPYAYDALSVAIGADVMKLHHQKHHQIYVDKLNAALDQASELKERTLIELLSSVDSLPEQVRAAVRNHGGGHYNHSLFWQCMTPELDQLPEGNLANAINEKWGSFDVFVEEFSMKAASLFGSGWVWLTRDMEIIAMPNQDTPMMIGKGEPLLGFDVWEHAYYLDYQNKRDEYIKNWWRVMNWRFVEGRYDR